MRQQFTYKGRLVRYQPLEQVWVFNIRNLEGKLERRVRNTARAAKGMININLATDRAT